jgi:hypothetical protein
MANNIESTVQSYIAMWNEPDAQARRALSSPACASR